MAKKIFASPFVLFTQDVTEDPVWGNASAHGHLDDDDTGVSPMNYDAWLNNVGVEIDGQEGIDWGDYKQWFVNNNLDTNQMDPLINPQS